MYVPRVAFTKVLLLVQKYFFVASHVRACASETWWLVGWPRFGLATIHGSIFFGLCWSITYCVRPCGERALTIDRPDQSGRSTSRLFGGFPRVHGTTWQQTVGFIGPATIESPFNKSRSFVLSLLYILADAASLFPPRQNTINWLCDNRVTIQRVPSDSPVREPYSI